MCKKLGYIKLVFMTVNNKRSVALLPSVRQLCKDNIYTFIFASVSHMLVSM